MVRSAVSKVLWVGRAATTLFGLALVLALIFGVASTAMSATGGNFILGKSNTARTVSKLTANVANPALQLINNSTDAAATALNISVAPDKAPLKVNATAGTATNLSADKLDGQDSAAFQRRVSGACPAGESIRSIGEDGATVVCEPDDQGDGGAAQVNQLRTELGANDGAPNEGSDPVNFSKVKDVPANVVNRDADTLDGKDSAGFIQNGTSAAQNASLNVNGTMRTSGMLRTGSETGTSQGPGGDTSNLGSSYNGLVVRRINSTNLAAGQVIARTNQLRLERDGTLAGLRISWDRGTPGTSLNNISCMGMNSAGASVNHYSQMDNLAAGTTQVFTDAQNVTYATCSFGDTYDARHTTQVTLQRQNGDNFWVGTVISTFNQ